MSRFEQSMSKYKAWNNATTLPLGAKAQTMAENELIRCCCFGQGIFLWKGRVQMDGDSRHRTRMDILTASNYVLQRRVGVCMPI